MDPREGRSREATDCVGRGHGRLSRNECRPLATFQRRDSQHAPCHGRHELLRVAVLHDDGYYFWVCPDEIFPVQIRAKGNSAATFVHWSFNLIFALVSPLALSAISFKYFYVFFITDLVATAYYVLFYPEMKGKALGQMDEVFGDQLIPHALEDPDGAVDVIQARH